MSKQTHMQTQHSGPASSASAEISVAELQARLEFGAPTFILDIRPTVERTEWAIPGSYHHDAYKALRDSDPNAVAEVTPPANTPVIVVCAQGHTARLGAEQLRKRGIPALVLDGGMKAWSLAWNTAELTSDRATVIQVRRTGKGCLSYLVGSGGEAIVVDPALDPDIYLRLAEARGWGIRHVLDTHVHADHLSRSRVLADQADARYWLPKQQRVSFPYKAFHDNDEISFGNSVVRGLSTPGHTGESMCFCVNDQWLLTGDTLFTSAVGRPDLEAGLDESLARAIVLHGSLRRLFELDPQLVVLPGHTGSPIPFDGSIVSVTLGRAREAIQLPVDAEQFAQALVKRIPPTPPNHNAIVRLNEAGELPKDDPTDLEAGANRCAVQ